MYAIFAGFCFYYFYAFLLTQLSYYLTNIFSFFRILSVFDTLMQKQYGTGIDILNVLCFLFHYHCFSSKFYLPVLCNAIQFSLYWEVLFSSIWLVFSSPILFLLKRFTSPQLNWGAFLC